MLMKRTVKNIAQLAVACLLSMNAMAENTLPSWSDVDYAGDGIVGHRLDIYAPRDGKSLHKVVVIIYGSAWYSNKDKEKAFREIGQPLLDAGFAVVSINHRASVEAKFPAQINDVKAAVRYVRAHARDYGFDTSFIGITGYSSGGHLSSLTGTTNGVKTFTVGKETVDIEGKVGNCLKSSSKVDAVVDWFGPVDMARMQDCSTTKDEKSPEATLLGVAPAKNLDLVALLGPATYIDKKDPMFLVIHGDADPVVPYCQSVNFSEALKKQGKLYDFVTVPNGKHGPVTFNKDTFAKMVAFFKKMAKMK